MRATLILLGLCTVALALPPRVLKGQGKSEIIQQSQAEFDEPSRLASLQLLARHEHHHDVELDGSGAHEGHASEKAKEEEKADEVKMAHSHDAVHSLPIATPHPQSSGGGGHDHHHSREPPKLVLDEAEILKTHSPDPPSYFDLDQTQEGMPATMIAHVVLMSFAYFGLLPLAIFLKSGGSHLSILPQIGFLAVSLLGLALGRVYSWGTPERYEGSSHTSWGWITAILSVALNFVDVFRFLVRFSRFEERFEIIVTSIKSKVGLGGAEEKTSTSMFDSERVALVESPTEELSPSRWSTDQALPQTSPSSSRGNSSTFSDADTIYDSAGPEAHPSSLASESVPSRNRLQTVVSVSLDLASRLLVILAYVNVCNGIAIYTGICRGNYQNGCFAHGIKGSIFLWYGLLTFARYCGGMSTLGWAWNKRPAGRGSIWTAEFVESFVIFFYGSTNTWMERWGKTGAYSVKDVQHISIAVMFFGAGALGMLLESSAIRSWLSAPAIQASNEESDRIAQPASASFSFNPFPALVIGVTGVAMSAHHQTYQFQVEIHALWGYLLAAFSFFRFLTYFFLYLRPPASILPSRPPTEALASLFLTCGGVVFILSTEQITFAAMRHQADDMMAFLNVTFALVCVLFFWIAVLFGIKGWASKRNFSSRQPSPPTVKSA